MIDDDAQPIVTAFYIMIDLIIFLLMMSSTFMFFKAGYTITKTSRYNMASRGVITASTSDEKKKQLLVHEKANNGSKATVRSTDVTYDGLLTGEEVYSNILAMANGYTKDVDGNLIEVSGNAYINKKTKEVLSRVVIRKSQYGSDIDLGATDSPDGSGKSVLSYSQLVDPELLKSYIELGTNDNPAYYKRTYVVHAYKKGNKIIHTQNVAMVRYTRVN